MSYPFYPQCQDQPDVIVAPNNIFGYGQYDAQRSKTPTSLINHTGHSPGPLSTPPLSRNASRGPEPLPENPPDQMVYDDGFGSLSNSPTSVRTPEDSSFEVDMLDPPMRDFYQSQNGPVPAQVSEGGPVPTIDTTTLYLTDQAIQEALNATMATQPQQFQAQFTMQSRSLQNTMPSQPYNNFYGHHYTNQPPRQDPWTGQGPPRNPDEPRSGMAVFDPVTDPVTPPVDYSAFINESAFASDVGYWTSHNTDPNFLVSPNDPMAPPQDFFTHTTQPHTAHVLMQQQQQQQQQQTNRIQHQPQLHHSSPTDMRPSRAQQPSQNWSQTHPRIPNNSPIEMRVTTASPSPDSQNFVNYDSTSPLFTDNYITRPMPPSLVTSIEQSPNSPLVSASSPGGSEGVFSSYQQSDSGMLLDMYPSDSFDPRFLPPPSPVQMERRSPASSIEVTFDISPEPEHAPVRRSGAPKIAGRPGGRALGTHLDAKVAKAAHDMRKTVACWHCVLQRDKCGPGDICERCYKRSQRPNADCGLGCSRIKLIELVQYFLPTLVMQIHEDTHLTHFVTQYIRQWNNQEITVYITCSQKHMPRIPVKVYEFAPRGPELLEQVQYQTDPKTQQRIAVKKRSPALGMVHINHNEEKKYDKYINDIVDNHLDAFADICWADDGNDFMPRLFKLMTRVKPKSDDEAKLLREVYRLIVCTYIMSHTLTIAEETKHQTLSKMHSYTDPNAYVQNFTSSRMTNRQLKYFFARLQRSTLSTVLNKLQQIFKSSKGCDKWIAAFVSVVGMAMAHEDQQKTVHQVMCTRAATEGFDPRDAQAQADIACREIDARMSFISQIFRWKYNRKCNPIKDADQDWAKEVGFGDESSVAFVRSVSQLCRDNNNYLIQRQAISISSSNQGKYAARLVGGFLNSFWLPQ